MRPFRFGVVCAQADSGWAWLDTARAAESLGYSTLLVPDHFGEQFGPFAALGAAAAATTILRLGTFVCDNDLRHPAVLAKEAATVDVLSDGRFELGVGAGWMADEHRQAGLPFDDGAVRLARLAETLDALRALWGDAPATVRGDHVRLDGLEGGPGPVQRPHPPLLVGGGGPRLLALAAAQADIVSIVPRSRADGLFSRPGELSPEALAAKVAVVRSAAAEQRTDPELNTLVLFVEVTAHRATGVRRVADALGVPPEVVDTSPHVLVGSPAGIAEQLAERRETFGISYVAVFDDALERFAPVVAEIAGR